MPNWVPPLKGLADFKGRVIHAHSFRDAQDFKGQRLLLIGNGYSGEDIAMQCVKFGAARATIGFRTAAAGHDFQDWPIVERKLPTHYDGASGLFKFEDGDGLEVDCVILRENKFYGAFVLNRRVDLHAIDATPARWRGDVGSSPLDGASAATSSPRNDLVKNYRVHPTHWLTSTQAATSARDVEARATQAFSAFSAVPCSTAS